MDESTTMTTDDESTPLLSPNTPSLNYTSVSFSGYDDEELNRMDPLLLVPVQNDNTITRNGVIHGECTPDYSHLLLNSERGMLIGGDTTDGELHGVNSIESDVFQTTVHQRLEPQDNEKLLSSKFESLDYDPCENFLYLRDEREKTAKEFIRTDFNRWLIMVLIGFLTAVVAVVIDISVVEMADLKHSTIARYVSDCVVNRCLYIPYLLWVALNTGMVFVAAFLVVFVEPVAAGSGIPQIKCYLNGVKVPRVVQLRTLLAKWVGVIFSVAGGLAVGKEGPMIHSGAVIAAGISQGESKTLNRDFNIFKSFRTDTEKRDFVSAGAAAGVAAAFGAPVGGVLFSLEEGASFWNQALTWRIFFASMISTFSLNLMLSAYHGHPGELSYQGLVNFGIFSDITYSWFEIPIYVVIGLIGGLSGALFNCINHKLTIFRLRYVQRRVPKMLEAIIVALITATVGFTLIYFNNDCQKPADDAKPPIQFWCKGDEYNAMGSLVFQTPEEAVKSLFHDKEDAFALSTMGLFCVCYYLLACLTYGISVPSGLFIPCLLTGAAWGRCIGVLLRMVLPEAKWVVVGKYALIGAAAQLGGVVRMTISLTVILVEATGNVTYGLPLIVVLMTAKLVGDLFNEGIYDIHIRLQSVPLLSWEPPQLSYNISVSEVMNSPVHTLNTIEKVSRIMSVLSRPGFEHNGFPVVTEFDEANENQFGKFEGIILRSQLTVLLKQKMFRETEHCAGSPRHRLRIQDFRNVYPRFPNIKKIHISPSEEQCTIDLRPFMNPAPYTILQEASLHRIFRLFRALGLRHIVVVNKSNQVVGIVTRKDLARYRVWREKGEMGMEQLYIS